MNVLINGFVLFALTRLFATCNDAPNDSVEKAKQTNNVKVNDSTLDKSVADFLVKIADARMMGIKEGTEAKEKGTIKEISDYGSLMIREQTELQEQINVLAKSKQVTLPDTLSKDKQDGLADLQRKSGRDFDKKFIKMMTIDHKRDLKDFKKATEYDDPEVRSFAVRYLPMIQTHLDKLNEIDKNYPSK